MDCLPCKGGYNCKDKGIGNIMKLGNMYKCPPGHYCPRGIGLDPYPCPAGTYLDEETAAASLSSFDLAFTGASSFASDVKSCKLCPVGYFCPIGTGNRYANPCPGGYICPLGSGDKILCPPGFYCKGPGEEQQVLCPEGFYCPMGTEEPIPCSGNQVCDAGSASSVQRKLTKYDCEEGTYLLVDRCLPCEPGHVCVQYTSQKYPIYYTPDDPDLDEGGYECPAGYYCPAGTTPDKIQACPPGTFRLDKRGQSIEDCLPCPDGSANSLFGSRVCILCGRGATNNENRDDCECIGAFRTWQESTNSCVCEKGYFDPTLTEADQTSTADLDCKPIVQPICGINEFINEDN